MTISNPEIEKTLVISTYHLDAKTIKISRERWGYIMATHHGVIVYIDVMDERGITSLGIPHLWKVVEEARQLGCNVIRYDRDGPIYRELETHEW